MKGNRVVYELTIPVASAIWRHVKSQSAFTDIYNHAYVAVMNGMDVNAAEIEKLQTRHEEAESALISMVQQYCYRPLDVNREPAINVYQHDFMSAGEEAFAYLVEHGLAQWTDEHKHSITMPQP